MNIAIVRATINGESTEEMLDIGVEYARERGLEVVEAVEVPGVHELPIAAEILLDDEHVDGVVTYGSVIQGSTDHDKVLAYNVSKQILELSCKHQKPVGYGVIGPGASWKQVQDRVEHYAKGAIDAVADTGDALTDL